MSAKLGAAARHSQSANPNPTALPPSQAAASRREADPANGSAGIPIDCVVIAANSRLLS
jgi:hypothetical protein